MKLHVNPLFPTVSMQNGRFLISTDAALFDLDLIHRYLSEESYWAKGRSRADMVTSMQHSFCVGVYALDDGQNGRFSQAGFCRVNTDFTVHAYVADLFILPDYRGQGLGKWLVKSLQQMPPLAKVGFWQLDTKDAQGLYAQFGFANAAEPEKHMVWFPPVEKR